jgi:type I restriction enzyme M protein
MPSYGGCRYVGAADLEDDHMPFPERFAALKASLMQQFTEASVIETAIKAALDRLDVR